MSEGLKKVLWPVLITVAIGIPAFLLKDVLIGKLIVPVVVEDLKNKGYVQDPIEEGKYVTVADQKAFASNHPINSKELIRLKNGEYLTVADLDTTQALNKMWEKINELCGITNDLKKINNAYRSGSFEVRLYTTTKDEERGCLFLNSENLLIQYFLEHLGDCDLRANGNVKSFTKIRFEALKLEGKSTSDAIGRLHQQDYDDLFKGVKGRVGYAQVKINPNH